MAACILVDPDADGGKELCRWRVSALEAGKILTHFT